MTTEPLVLTIGHSTLPAERFVALLQQHGVETVCDVRSQPYSRHVPHVNREALEQTLGRVGIGYEFLGRELGARSSDRDAYDDEGRVRYDALRSAPAFQQALDRIEADARAGRVQALLCAEKDPADCHRSVLVADAIVLRGLRVAHIHSDGRLETQRQMLDRLMGPPSLLDDGDQSTRERRALRDRERVIAYVDARLAAERTGA